VEFSVFPNPAKNRLTISSSETIGDVTLLDLFSRVISCEVVPAENKSWVFDTRNIASGIYFLRIKGIRKEFTTKVIIEK
jgi:hypothetical protein